MTRIILEGGGTRRQRTVHHQITVPTTVWILRLLSLKRTYSRLSEDYHKQGFRELYCPYDSRMTLRRNKFLAVTFPVSILPYSRQLLTDLRPVCSTAAEFYSGAVRSVVQDREDMCSTRIPANSRQTPTHPIVALGLKDMSSTDSQLEWTSPEHVATVAVTLYIGDAGSVHLDYRGTTPPHTASRRLARNRRMPRPTNQTIWVIPKMPPPTSPSAGIAERMPAVPTTRPT